MSELEPVKQKIKLLSNIKSNSLRSLFIIIQIVFLEGLTSRLHVLTASGDKADIEAAITPQHSTDY